LADPLSWLATLGILPYALRASLRLFKIAPGDFVVPNAKHRHLIVTRQTTGSAPQHPSASPETRDVKPTAPMTWMQRLHRVFEIDLRFCPRCGAATRVIAAITHPALIDRILRHRDHSARAPPNAPFHAF